MPCLLTQKFLKYQWERWEILTSRSPRVKSRSLVEALQADLFSCIISRTGDSTEGGRKSASEEAYKPDSVPQEHETLAWAIISLGLELPRASSNLPEDLDRASRCADAFESARVFLFGLAPGDAYRAGDVTTTAVGSYPTVSPLPEPQRPDGIPSRWPSAVCFLWCWCRIAPPGSYPAPCPWSPDFPPDTGGIERPPSLLTRAHLV